MSVRIKAVVGVGLSHRVAWPFWKLEEVCSWMCGIRADAAVPGLGYWNRKQGERG